MRFPWFSEPLRDLLGEELWNYYELGDLFAAPEETGYRWVLRQGLEWYAGPLIGGLLAEMVETAADVVYPPYSPQWA